MVDLQPGCFLEAIQNPEGNQKTTQEDAHVFERFENSRKFPTQHPPQKNECREDPPVLQAIPTITSGSLAPRGSSTPFGAAEGPIGFQTIWWLALVANIIRQRHPGQLKRCVVRTGWKKTGNSFLLKRVTFTYTIYLTKAAEKPWKYVESSFFVVSRVSRRKKSQQLCASEKERAVFPNGGGIAIKNKIEQVRFSSMVPASLWHKTGISVRAKESVRRQYTE